MSWMCLERCNDTKSDIADQLFQISKHRRMFSGISFEIYNMYNGSLVKNNLTNVGWVLKEMKLETWPMISSYPYPPEFLDWMRKIFKNPNSFVKQCVDEIKKTDYTGYNVDWEPTSKTATTQDATNYANFLGYFANEMHKIGKKLSVDVATWSSLWDFKKISDSKIDRIFDMGTYTKNFTTFQTQLNKATRLVANSKLGIGLESFNYTNNEIESRFDVIIQNQIQEVDIWRNPIPNNWWPLFGVFCYILAPIPSAVGGIATKRLGGSTSPVFNSTDNRHLFWVDLGLFVSTFLLISGLALPIVFFHSAVIDLVAMVLSECGGIIVYVTISSFIYFFLTPSQKEPEFI